MNLRSEQEKNMCFEPSTSYYVSLPTAMDEFRRASTGSQEEYTKVMKPLVVLNMFGETCVL